MEFEQEAADLSTLSAREAALGRNWLAANLTWDQTANLTD